MSIELGGTNYKQRYRDSRCRCFCVISMYGGEYMIVIKQGSGVGLVDVLAGDRIVAEDITLIEMLDLLEECVYRVMEADVI